MAGLGRARVDLKFAAEATANPRGLLEPGWPSPLSRVRHGA